MTAPPNAFFQALAAACPLSLGRSHRSCKYSDPADFSGLLAESLEQSWAASGRLQGAPGQWPDAFVHQQLLYMTLLGWLVFARVPKALVIAGAAVVVASGLHLLWLEIRSR